MCLIIFTSLYKRRKPALGTRCLWSVRSRIYALYGYSEEDMHPTPTGNGCLYIRAFHKNAS